MSFRGQLWTSTSVYTKILQNASIWHPDPEHYVKCMLLRGVYFSLSVSKIDGKLGLFAVIQSSEILPTNCNVRAEVTLGIMKRGTSFVHARTDRFDLTKFGESRGVHDVCSRAVYEKQAEVHHHYPGGGVVKVFIRVESMEIRIDIFDVLIDIRRGIGATSSHIEPVPDSTDDAKMTQELLVELQQHRDMVDDLKSKLAASAADVLQLHSTVSKKDAVIKTLEEQNATLEGVPQSKRPKLAPPDDISTLWGTNASEMIESLQSKILRLQTQTVACSICLCNEPSIVFTPCGHKVTCKTCSDTLSETDADCPVCRRPVVGRHRVFQ
jgi:hypothetical protein